MNHDELLKEMDVFLSRRGIRAAVIIVSLADGQELRKFKGNSRETLGLLCAHAEVARCEAAFEWLPLARKVGGRKSDAKALEEAR